MPVHPPGSIKFRKKKSLRRTISIFFKNSGNTIKSNQRLANGLYWAVKFFFIVVLVKLVIDVTVRISDRKYHISNIEIPEEIRNMGFTSDVMTNQILAKLNFINSAAADVSNTKMDQVPPPYEKFDLDVTDNSEELEYSGISYRRLVAFISNIFSPRRYITGNIVFDKKSGMVLLITKFSNKKNSGSVGSRDSLPMKNKLDLLALKTAAKIYATTNPLQYSLFLYRMTDYKRCLEFLDGNFRSFNNKKDKIFAYWLKASCLRFSGKLNESLVSFENAIAFEPSVYNNYANVASVFIDLKKMDSAKWYIDKVASITMKDVAKADYLNIKGNYYNSLRKFDSAIYFYKQSLQHDQQYYVYSNLGGCYANLGNFDSSAFYFDQLRAVFNTNYLKPRDYIVGLGFFTKIVPYSDTSVKRWIEEKKEIAKTYKYPAYMIADYYYHTGNLDSAECYLDNVIKQDSAFMEAYVLKGNIFNAVGNLTKANDFYRKANTFGKQNAELLSSWANNLLNQNDRHSALSKTDILFNIGYNLPLTLSLVGRIYESNDLLEAEYNYKLSDCFNSSNISNLTNLANLKKTQGEFSEAITYCNSILDIDSLNNGAIMQLVECKTNMNDYVELDYMADRLFSLNNSLAGYMLKAKNAERRNKEDEAFEFYLKAYSIDNYNQEALRKIGRYYMYHEKFQKAIFYMTQYESIIVLNETQNIDLGFCYAKLNNHHKAITYFKKAARLNPKNCVTLKNWAISLNTLREYIYEDNLFLSYLNSNPECNLEALINSFQYRR